MDQQPEKSEPVWRRAIRERAQKAWRVVKTQAAKIDLKKLRWKRIAAYVTAVAAGLIVLVAAAGLGLNTAPGKRFLLGFVNDFTTDTGLKVHVGAIDGSIYGDLTLRDIRVSDPKGVFLTSPKVHLDWRPLAWFHKHVDIRDLSTPRVDVLRLPEPNPGKPKPKNGALLPDLDIDVARVQADVISLHAGVAGADARTLSFGGVAHIVRGRAQITATAFSDKNDQLGLRLDARPDADRLDLDAHLNAPQDGVVVNLAGLDRPLRADLTGKGSWKQWTGRLKASLAGDSLADLALTARDGRFTVTGPTRPDLILTGESGEILKPNVQVAFDGTLRKRRLDVALGLTSDVAAVKAKGLLDLAYSRFGHVEIHANLLKPERLEKGFTAQDLHADLRVDGAFVTPRVDYDIDATRFGLGGLKVAGLHAEGKSRFDDGQLLVPVQAEWASLSGIDARVDPLLTHFKLSGDLILDHAQLSSRNLRLRTDRVQATADLSADLGRGMFASTVKANLKGYRLEKVGTVDLNTGVRIARTKTGQLTLAGDFDAKSTQWENDGIAKFLGGNAKLKGTYGMAPGGRIFVGKLSGGAPDFTLLSGDGTFGPRGALLFKATAQSKQYGPLELAVTGTAAKPQNSFKAVLKAASPGLGMQIKDVVAELAPDAQGFAVKATGGSAYGPFSADTVLITANGPLAVDIRQGRFAGIDMTGRLTQTQAGPFAGTLALNGSGLTGTARLDSSNGDQSATIDAVGNNVDLPGDMKVHVGRAIIAARAVLKKQIEVDGDVQMADVTYQTFTLATGRAKVMLRGENGTVQAVAHGRKDIPFDLAVNAKIAPNLYTVAAQGKANDIAFRLDHPARIERRGDTFVLAPVAVITPSGRMDLAGAFGNGYRLQARLAGVDLGLIDAFRTDAGITGKMDGAVDFTQDHDAYPTMRANLKISRFSRASAAVASTPVDLAIDAALTPGQGPDGNYARALVRQGGAIVGRIQLNLTPAAPGAGWMKQVSNAGVTGGIRYNGPAGVLFSLAGQPRQQLDGPVAVAADVSGQLNAPHLNGVIKANSLTYDNEDLGTRINAVSLDGHFSNDKLELTKFHGKAGDGEVSGTGWVSLAANEKFPLQVHIDLYRARLARSDSIDSTVSGSLDLSNDATNGAWIKGDLRLPQLRYTVVRQGAAEVNELEGVHHKGYQKVQTTQTGIAPPALWKLDIRARADNQIFVSGMGLESEWRMNLHVTGTSRDPRIDGEMTTVHGYYQFAGRDFNIDEGTIRFNGGVLTDPEIDLTASASVKDINGIIRVNGSAQRPEIAFASTPALPQDEVLSRMLFGESVTNLSATEALQLASAVNGLAGGKDYLNPLGVLRAATGIDRLRVVGADTASGRGTAVAAGKYLTNSVYVEIVTDSKGFTGTQIEIALSRALSLLSSTGGTAGTSVGVRYSRDY